MDEQICKLNCWDLTHNRRCGIIPRNTLVYFFVTFYSCREHTVEHVIDQLPNLGLIIDLTNTNKYYSGDVRVLTNISF